MKLCIAMIRLIADVGDGGRLYGRIGFRIGVHGWKVWSKTIERVRFV